MVDSSPVYCQKRVLYPPKLGCATQLDSRRTRELLSLVDLSSQEIVLDSAATTRSLSTIPHELFYPLLKAALKQSKDRSVDVLVSNWPFKVLTLHKFVQPLFEDLAVLYHNTSLTEWRRGIKYTTWISHSFVECLKKRAPTKLKYLDISGFPTAEVIVNYLASHVMLVHNEVRQRDIINMYNEVTKKLSGDRKQHYNLNTTLPDDDGYVIVIDAFLIADDTHMELCRALKISQTSPCPFRLKTTKLDLAEIGVARISVLLEQVEPECLTGLSLQFNSVDNAGLTILGPSIQTLINLTTLDLSFNLVNLIDNDKTCDILGESFSKLTSLRRLNISHNRVRNKLRSILSRIPQCLMFLGVSACGLRETDLIYLRTSHHVLLKELDISSNNLRTCFDSFVSFLKALSPTVTVLEMEDCQLTEDNISTLSPVAGQMLLLQYWDIDRNQRCHIDILLSAVVPLVRAPKLEALKLAYPMELANWQIVDQMDEQRQTFREIFSKLLQTYRKELHLPSMKVLFG